MFTPTVAGKLNYYVYRLIDPRNGETFYIGKGRGNRLFAHVKGELRADTEELTDTFLRIRKIRADGFDIAHVVHRHGLTEDQAFEVEAALIDAYPEVTNQLGGKYSNDRGLMHAQQVIEKYEAPIVKFRHKAILITINRSIIEQDNIYDATRYAWKVDPKKASQTDIVLAIQRGLVVDVFIADQWLSATTKNFPEKLVDRPGRWGFRGRRAPSEIAKHYVRHRIPDSMRKRGAANPIKYVL
jgi:hypothetical protein